MKLHAGGAGVFPDLLPDLLLVGDRIGALDPDCDAVESKDDRHFAGSRGGGDRYCFADLEVLGRGCLLSASPPVSTPDQVAAIQRASCAGSHDAV